MMPGERKCRIAWLPLLSIMPDMMRRPLATDSHDPHCEGQKTEYLLGYASVSPTSDTPRSWTRCRQPSLDRYSAVIDAGCQPGEINEGLIGYVH